MIVGSWIHWQIAYSTSMKLNDSARKREMELKKEFPSLYQDKSEKNEKKQTENHPKTPQVEVKARKIIVNDNGQNTTVDDYDIKIISATEDKLSFMHPEFDGIKA